MTFQLVKVTQRMKEKTDSSRTMTSYYLAVNEKTESLNMLKKS